MIVHTLYPNGSVQEWDWRYDRASSIDPMKAAVGGDIEYIAVLHNGKRATLVVNETGAVNDRAINPRGILEPNARATAIYWTATIQGKTPVQFRPLLDPMIHGPAVLIEKDKREL